MDSVSDSIISAISQIFRNMFSSIDDSIYSALDKISFIDDSIMSSPYLSNTIGHTSSSGILLIANGLLIGFVLYFAIKYILANFSIGNPQNPYKFVLKIIIIGIIMNNCFFICEQIININSSISSGIRSIGQNVLGTKICFSNLIKILNSIVSIEENSESFFSIDGIIKTIVSIGFLNLIFVFSVRYIMLKVFILFSPFAILFMSLDSTSGFFKAWFKSFISLLLIELFSSLILIIMFSIQYSPTDIVSKILFVGSIFALTKVNSFIRDIFGGISLDFQNSLYSLRNINTLK